MSKGIRRETTGLSRVSSMETSIQRHTQLRNAPSGELAVLKPRPKPVTKTYADLRAAIVPPYDSRKFPNKWRKMDPDRPARTILAHIGRDSYSQSTTTRRRPAAVLNGRLHGFRVFLTAFLGLRGNTISARAGVYHRAIRPSLLLQASLLVTLGTRSADGNLRTLRPAGISQTSS